MSTTSSTFTNPGRIEDDDNTTELVLARFIAADDANVAIVDETAHHETGVISLSAKHIREMQMRFPELLLVDCTHQTNRCGVRSFVVAVTHRCGRKCNNVLSMRPMDYPSTITSCARW